MSTPRIGRLARIGESGQRATSLTRRTAVRLGSGAQVAPHTYQEGVDRLSQMDPESGRNGAAARSFMEWCGETILAAWWLLMDRGE